MTIVRYARIPKRPILKTDEQHQLWQFFFLTVKIAVVLFFCVITSLLKVKCFIQNSLIPKVKETKLWRPSCVLRNEWSIHKTNEACPSWLSELALIAWQSYSQSISGPNWSHLSLPQNDQLNFFGFSWLFFAKKFHQLSFVIYAKRL